MTKSHAFGRRRSVAAAIGFAVALTIGFVGVAPAAQAAAGDQVWVARDHHHRANVARALGVSPDGARVYVTGYAYGASTDEDYATDAYDAARGVTLWTRRYDGPSSSLDDVTTLAIGPDGSAVFVTGSSYGVGSTNPDYATVAYDATTGKSLWAARYDGPGHDLDLANALAASPDSARVFVAGASIGAGTGYDFATVAYDATSGTRLWTRRYDGPAGGDDSATALAVSPDGSTVFVAGESSGSRQGYSIVAYDAVTGSVVLVHRFSRAAVRMYRVSRLAVSPDGSALFVSGDQGGMVNGYDYGVLALDAISGARLWANEYNGPGNSDDVTSDLAVSPDGSRILMTGSSPGVGGDVNEFATVVFDAATGSTLWVARYSATEYGAVATALAVSADGSRVYVTGSGVWPDTATDYVTVAYDMAGGEQLWIGRYDGPGDWYDDAAAVGVSPDGSRVFVTGASWAAGSKMDYATVAYSTD